MSKCLDIGRKALLCRSRTTRIRGCPNYKHASALLMHGGLVGALWKKGLYLARSRHLRLFLLSVPAVLTSPLTSPMVGVAVYIGRAAHYRLRCARCGIAALPPAHLRQLSSQIYRVPSSYVKVVLRFAVSNIGSTAIECLAGTLGARVIL